MTPLYKQGTVGLKKEQCLGTNQSSLCKCSLQLRIASHTLEHLPIHFPQFSNSDCTLHKSSLLGGLPITPPLCAPQDTYPLISCTIRALVARRRAGNMLTVKPTFPSWSLSSLVTILISCGTWANHLTPQQLSLSIKQVGMLMMVVIVPLSQGCFIHECINPSIVLRTVASTQKA